MINVKYVPAYDRREEVKELFDRYTDMLIEGDPGFKEFLKMQKYDDELENPAEKYGMPDGRLYLAYVDDKLAGCVGLRRFDDTRCELKRLYVKPEYRGRHLGSEMLGMIIDEAKKIGYDQMLLDTLPFLESALKMYKGFGFTETGRHNNSPLDTSIYMKLDLRFEFRDIRHGEADQATELEEICFPPHEAVDDQFMIERVHKVPDLFLVAEDRESGKIAGFLTGIAVNEEKFRDEFFTDASLHDPEGDSVMLLGLNVHPDHRGQGLARELIRRYQARERGKGRKRLVLTCSDDKVKMYTKMGFTETGMSASTWGNEKWHEMVMAL